MALEELLQAYHAQRPHLESLRNSIVSRLEAEGERIGLPLRVSGRVKDDLSLARKLAARGATQQSYDAIRDKCGIRVVCRFRTDADEVRALIREAFHVEKEEDLATRLGVNQFGYESIHFDVKVTEARPFNPAPPALVGLFAEIQVRTLSEDVWAEVAHDILYKPASDLPPDAARRVYSLAGLLQVAEDHIEGIHHSLEASKRLTPEVVIRTLEEHYWRLSKREFAHELTLKVLKNLIPALPQDYDEAMGGLEDFAENHLEKLRAIIQERGADLPKMPILSQPEAFLIFYLLEKWPNRLAENWVLAFPADDLRKLATAWGKPIDELLA